MSYKILSLQVILWVLFLLFSNRVKPNQDESCYSVENEQCEEKDSDSTLLEFELEGDMVRMISPSAIPRNLSNEDSRCNMWADMGLCNMDTEYMLRNCIPACLNTTIVQTHGLLTFGSYNKYRILLKPSLGQAYLTDGDECVDTYDPSIHLNSDGEGCESWRDRGEFENSKKKTSNGVNM